MSKEAKIVNQNFIIYSGISLAFFAVICIFKFLFTAIAVSYVLGCVLCYYGLKSETFIVYLDKIKCSFLGEDQKISNVELSKGCTACGDQFCDRHNSVDNLEPWVGLKVHKQLDQAIEDFYNAILEQFICSWHNKISPDPFFVDELRFQLRYASSCLLRRAEKINYSRFITERLIPCALHHYTVCSALPEGVSLIDSKLAIHPAASNRNAELKYLRSVTNAIMPYLLRSTELDNSVFHVLIREIFSGWVLLPLTDVLADPYILNSLIILSTGKETVARLPTTPNYKVEFLETFVRHVDSVYSRRTKLHKLDLDFVLSDPEHLYALMQFMKTEGHLGLLQFCKHIKSFQSRILNPELTSSEQVTLFNEAWDLWVTYFDPESPNSINFDPKIVEEFRMLLADGSPNVKKLQTSRALYEAAKQCDLVLEKHLIPMFMHSEEYYKILIGVRCVPDYRKFLTKRSSERMKLKPKNRDLSNDRSLGQLTTELEDNMNWLNYAAEEEAFREQDLSTCKVVLTNVELGPHEIPHRNPVRIFTLAVHRAGPRDVVLCSPKRSEHDFHMLRAKLAEFHGEVMLQHLPLPSRKDNSPLETLRYKYEDFLQRLLHMNILHNSELLTIFLLEEGDFTKAVLSASLSANSTDLTQLYQSVTHRLRKEKGQHLESFMNVLLISSEKDRWDNRKDIEVGQECDEYIEVPNHENRPRNVRNIHSSIFGDHLGIEPVIYKVDEQRNSLVGFTQCFFYLLIKVIKVHSVVVRILGSVISVVKDLVDPMFNNVMNATLQSLLSERRLAHFIRLGHALLFGKKSLGPRSDAREHAELAKKQLLENIPDSVKYIAGSNFHTSVITIFNIIQKPQLNKQLIYNLLDLCLLELFPELKAENTEKESKIGR